MYFRTSSKILDYSYWKLPTTVVFVYQDIFDFVQENVSKTEVNNKIINTRYIIMVFGHENNFRKIGRFVHIAEHLY